MTTNGEIVPFPHQPLQENIQEVCNDTVTLLPRARRPFQLRIIHENYDEATDGAEFQKLIDSNTSIGGDIELAKFLFAAGKKLRQPGKTD